MIVDCGKTNKADGITMLKSGDDLDDILTPGTYVVPGGEGILNDPCANWATMQVIGASGGMSMTSQIMIGIPGQTYTRVKSGSPAKWNVWNHIKDSSNA